MDNVGLLESLMVPADYSKNLEANIPSEFAGLPRLLGRAKVRKLLYLLFCVGMLIFFTSYNMVDFDFDSVAAFSSVCEAVGGWCMTVAHRINLHMVWAEVRADIATIKNVDAQRTAGFVCLFKVCCWSFEGGLVVR